MPRDNEILNALGRLVWALINWIGIGFLPIIGVVALLRAYGVDTTKVHDVDLIGMAGLCFIVTAMFLQCRMAAGLDQEREK